MMEEMQLLLFCIMTKRKMEEGEAEKEMETKEDSFINY